MSKELHCTNTSWEYVNFLGIFGNLTDCYFVTIIKNQWFVIENLQAQLGSLVFRIDILEGWACGTERQIQAQLLKENICHFLIEGLGASCFRCDLSQLDLGNWLCWECLEDRWGEDEQVLLVLLVEKFWKSSLSFSSAWAPGWSHIISQRVQEIHSQKKRLIMSNRAGASLNKSPREAKLLDQCDASRTRLSLMIDGLIIYIF